MNIISDTVTDYFFYGKAVTLPRWLVTSQSGFLGRGHSDAGRGCGRTQGRTPAIPGVGVGDPTAEMGPRARAEMRGGTWHKPPDEWLAADLGGGAY